MYRTEAGTGEVSAVNELIGTPGLSRLSAILKRGADLMGTSLLLSACLPLLCAVAIGVLISSRGPIIYSQERVGLNGRRFRILKFRSMRVDADRALALFLDTNPEALSEWKAFQKLAKDPRVTKFGRFIRRTSLDELPQFWNVLRGDMSLIGPRPVTITEAERYGPAWRAYCAVRPGITGLWQVSGRSNISYTQRVQLDVRYVEHWSIWLDLKILAKTVRVVFGGDGSF